MIIVSPISSLRVGLKTILASIPGIKVVAEAGALEDLSALPPNADILIVASLDSPASPWLNSITQSYPGRSFLFLVNVASIIQPLILPKNELVSLLNLDITPQELEAAIHALNAGLITLDPKFMGKLQFTPEFTALSTSSNHQPETNFEERAIVLEELTPRESEILQILALGLTNKEIARQFSISEHTVKYHMDSIFSKLGVNNRTEAVRQGVRLGIIII